MAMTFLKQPTSFGQSFGEGVGSSLQRLAAGRLQQIENQNEQRSFAKSLQSAFPDIYTPEMSNFVSQLDPKQRVQALEKLSSYLQPQQEQGEQQRLDRLSPSFQEEPTIAGAAQEQRAQELRPETQKPELTQSDALQLLQEGQTKQLQQNLQLPDASQLTQIAQSLGYKMTPEKEQQLQQKLEEIKNNPELLQQAKQKYDEKVANNETVEFRKAGSTAPAVPYEQAVQQLQQQKRVPFQKGLSEYQQMQAQQAKERIENQKNTQIEKTNKPYNDAVDKRVNAADEAYDKAMQMKDLLEAGDVATGISGYKPLVFQSSDSQVFNGLGDDVAAALTGLQSGTQTVSKIKFNKERKANLSQDRNTQNRRVDDMAKTALKILVEGDIRNSLIQNGKQTENMSAAVSKIYNKIKAEIPDVPENAEIGKEFVDPATGAIWTVSGNRMQFSGLAERR